METSEQISADLRSVLLEKHVDFEILHTYKGVPFACKAILRQVEAGKAYLQLIPLEAVFLENAKQALLLSDGLLEPLEAQIDALDLRAGEVQFSNFMYAGTKLSNRKELRVEPDAPIEVEIEADGKHWTGELLDLAMRGLGVRLNVEGSAFNLGQIAQTTLALEGGAVRLMGKIRNISAPGATCRLAFEFVGAAGDKTPIVRYIMRRRVEIQDEVRQRQERYRPKQEE